MLIAQIRRVIESADHTRNWLTGGTAEEFRKQAVGPSLRKKIEELQALDIASRFADDIEERAKEIKRCEEVIARWEAAQKVAPADRRSCAEGGPRHVQLGTASCVLCGAPMAQRTQQ